MKMFFKKKTYDALLDPSRRKQSTFIEFTANVNLKRAMLTIR